MSTIKIFSVSLLLFCLASLSSFGQERTEKRSARSTCFSGKIEVSIQHATPGDKNGSISLSLPRGAGSTKIFWIGFKVGKEASRIDKIAAGFYTIVIVDDNGCSTQIQNVEVKEVP